MAVLGKVTVKLCSLAGLDKLDDSFCFFSFFYNRRPEAAKARPGTVVMRGAVAPEMMGTPCQRVGGEFPSQTIGLFFTIVHFTYFFLTVNHNLGYVEPLLRTKQTNGSYDSTLGRFLTRCG